MSSHRQSVTQFTVHLLPSPVSHPVYCTPAPTPPLRHNASVLQALQHWFLVQPSCVRPWPVFVFRDSPRKFCCLVLVFLTSLLVLWFCDLCLWISCNLCITDCLPVQLSPFWADPTPCWSLSSKEKQINELKPPVLWWFSIKLCYFQITPYF